MFSTSICVLNWFVILVMSLGCLIVVVLIFILLVLVRSSWLMFVIVWMLFLIVRGMNICFVVVIDEVCYFFYGDGDGCDLVIGVC